MDCVRGSERARGKGQAGVCGGAGWRQCAHGRGCKQGCGGAPGALFSAWPLEHWWRAAGRCSRLYNLWLGRPQNRCLHTGRRMHTRHAARTCAARRSGFTLWPVFMFSMSMSCGGGGGGESRNHETPLCAAVVRSSAHVGGRGGQAGLALRPHHVRELEGARVHVRALGACWRMAAGGSRGRRCCCGG